MSTKQERDDVDDRINYIVPKTCNGDVFAEKYLYHISYVSRKIDDLYDGDNEVTKEEIDRLFYLLLVDIPSNPFVIKNFGVLLSQHLIIYNCWRHANLWNDDPDDTKRLYAYVIRDYMIELIPLVAFLTGGTENMNKIALEARSLFLSED